MSWERCGDFTDAELNDELSRRKAIMPTMGPLALADLIKIRSAALEYAQNYAKSERCSSEHYLVEVVMCAVFGDGFYSEWWNKQH